MANYKIIIKDKSGDTLGEFENAMDFSFSKRLNNFGTCEFSVPYNDPKLESLVSLRQYETYIQRDDTIIWGGEQASRNVNLQANSSNLVTIRSFEFFEVLRSRYTAASVIYEDTDAGAIAWDLINTSQEQDFGDYGFTQGVIEVTMDRDRKYYNQNVLEAIINLSNVINGFDFEITQDKMFSVYAHKGDTKEELVFKWGQNIKNVRIDENFTRPINRAIILGEKFDGSQLRVERNSFAEQAIYSLREDIQNELTVSEENTLQSKGDALLRQYKNLLLKVEFSQLPTTAPSFGTWSLGDSVRVIIQAGFYNIDIFPRIYGYDVTVDKDNKETISFLVGLI